MTHEMNRYTVHVIEPDWSGPGPEIYSASSRRRIDAWLARTGAAHHYHYGVVIRSPGGQYDFGDGWQPTYQ